MHMIKICKTIRNLLVNVGDHVRVGVVNRNDLFPSAGSAKFETAVVLARDCSVQVRFSIASYGGNNKPTWEEEER